MAWRVSDRVLEGEIDNTIRERVTGWIRIAGMSELLQLDLEGDCHPDLAGWRFRIVRTDPEPVGEEISVIDGLTSNQFGSAGDITADQLLKHFDCTITEFLARHHAGEPVPTQWRKALYLEWYSNSNGRVVIQSTRLAVERLGERAFELTEADLHRKDREAQQELDELRRQGFIIEEVEPGVTLFRSPDANSDPDSNAHDADQLQSYLDQQTRDLDQVVQDSWDDPSRESDDDQ